MYVAVGDLACGSVDIGFHQMPEADHIINKKLSYCWETVRRESMPRIAEMDVEMTT